MALQDYCIKCNKMYTSVNDQWCKQCQINYLRKNFTSWTSGSEKIDNFIQEKQLEINDSQDLVFEWIPYNQFLDIKEVDKNDFSTIYLAKWRNGSLYWDENIDKYLRKFDIKVALKYLHNLQNLDEFLDKV